MTDYKVISVKIESGGRFYNIGVDEDDIYTTDEGDVNVYIIWRKVALSLIREQSNNETPPQYNNVDN